MRVEVAAVGLPWRGPTTGSSSVHHGGPQNAKVGVSWYCTWSGTAWLNGAISLVSSRLLDRVNLGIFSVFFFLNRAKVSRITTDKLRPLSPAPQKHTHCWDSTPNTPVHPSGILVPWRSCIWSTRLFPPLQFWFLLMNHKKIWISVIFFFKSFKFEIFSLSFPPRCIHDRLFV